MTESNSQMNIYINDSHGLSINNIGGEVYQIGPRAKFLKSRKINNMENLL